MKRTTSLWAGLLVLGHSAAATAAEGPEGATSLQGLDLLAMGGVGLLALLLLLRRRPPR